ncbi:MAG: heat shock protein Hsp20 [Candidatus Bathyarchaeota archaeon B24]|nr:MAG: heat shock protein Hsp20 [Candidatus Bathyarchaeota archaeon B24]RLI25486.1 MAG: Hsp20/alpha crystallin family protein [Candidatus Bathyarchaeota archaeon]
MVRDLSFENWWTRWFRRRRWPFFRSWFFEDIDEMFREMMEEIEREFEEFSKNVPKELVRERTLPDGTKVKEWGPFVYGYVMTVGPDGKPKVREFGNVRLGIEAGRPRVSISERREPLVDVMSTDGEVKVIAELPGVEKKDIRLFGTEDTLTISVDTPERKYYKEIQLPAKVDPKKAKSSYKNGVLEVVLPKKEEKPKPKGEPIKIE